jgi:hypothetical protein
MTRPVGMVLPSTQSMLGSHDYSWQMSLELLIKKLQQGNQKWVSILVLTFPCGMGVGR